MNAPPFVIRDADYQIHREQLHAVRRSVFIVEQHVPEHLEWDDMDGQSRHVLALSAGGEPIGTGRLLPDGHIGRMAVLEPWRGKGVGSAILTFLLGLAREEKFEAVRLHAQTHALGFYARHGFAAEGPEFMEAGIPHRAMVLRL